jgi:esterase
MTTAVEPREHTLKLRGLRFHYVEWGDAGAPAIVLLHGLSSTGRIWDGLARALQDRYRLLAPDQRGHAATSWPEGADYTTDDLVGDVEALVDAWGLDRFVLIGLSMGGMNSMAYAARHPERVTRLVAVDISPKVHRDLDPMRPYYKKVAEEGHPAFDSPDDAIKLIRATNTITSDEALRHRLRYILKQLPDGRWTYRYDPRISYHWTPVDLWDELPKIQAPTLIVRGGQSNVLKASTVEKMLAALPNGQAVCIEAAGHTVPEDTPAEFIAAVEAFLAG